jgi:hypothetical protein
MACHKVDRSEFIFLTNVPNGTFYVGTEPCQRELLERAPKRRF